MDLPGNAICDLADKIMPLDLKPLDRVVFNKGDESTPILIVAIGEIKLRNGTQEVATLKQGSVYGDLFQKGSTTYITEAQATERSVVFKINLSDFYFVLASHIELVQGLIKNVTGKQIKAEL